MAAANPQTTERMTRADTSFFILTALFLKKHSSRTLEYASSYFFKSRLVKIKNLVSLERYTVRKIQSRLARNEKSCAQDNNR